MICIFDDMELVIKAYWGTGIKIRLTLSDQPSQKLPHLPKPTVQYTPASFWMGYLLKPDNTFKYQSFNYLFFHIKVRIEMSLEWVAFSEIANWHVLHFDPACVIKTAAKHGIRKKRMNFFLTTYCCCTKPLCKLFSWEKSYVNITVV